MVTGNKEILNIKEFEKDIIRERVVPGLENVKRKGKQPGVGEGTIRNEDWVISKMGVD